jgi:hypothetical protein
MCGKYDPLGGFKMRGSFDLVSKVSKVELLAKLEENKAKHIAAHEKAMAGWKRKMREATSRATCMIDAGSLFVFPQYLSELMRVPRSYIESYDRAIEMVGLSVAEYIELSANDFDRLINDNWEWRGDWDATNSHYA